MHLSHGFHSEVWHSCAGGFELHCRLSAASWDWGTHSGGTCSLLLDYFYFDVYWSIIFFYWGIMWQLKLLFLRFRLPWVQLPSCWCGRRLRALTTPFGPVQRSWRIWSWVPGGLLGFFFVFLLLFNWFGILIFLVYGLSDLMFQMTWPRRRHAVELDFRSAQACSAMHWAVWSKFHGSKFRSRNIFLCRILRNILVLQFFIQAREALSFSETLCALWDPSLQLLQTSKVIRDLQLLITYDFKFSIFF